ncbi:hypothetical protein LWI28_012784 [Acer negundo]|uniref:Uncharacterized protein n=1 Tax=Acer negundo TaxID=4023 RepID=A0AAD5NIZ8_ACENE|nr:hypothetical protein LWI28_012784 [Acer negundo]
MNVGKEVLMSEEFTRENIDANPIRVPHIKEEDCHKQSGMFSNISGPGTPSKSRQSEPVNELYSVDLLMSGVKDGSSVVKRKGYVEKNNGASHVRGFYPDLGGLYGAPELSLSEGSDSTVDSKGQNQTEGLGGGNRVSELQKNLLVEMAVLGNELGEEWKNNNEIEISANRSSLADRKP